MRILLLTLAVSLTTSCATVSNAWMGGMTRGEFREVEVGMSYDQVKDIAGIGGELVSTSARTQIYRWSGNGKPGGGAYVTFVDRRVYSKSQHGLAGL